jgi:2-polyprenyl-3-methyl-5-hydroxy-6-metoxy-1,4-benzoquinol methylase
VSGRAATPARALNLACPACGGRADGDPGSGLSCGACGARYPEVDGILRLVAGSSGAPGYDPHYFESLPRIEARHFWFVARREVILDAMRRHIPDLDRRPLFDIGCGTGGLVSYLAAEGVPVGGACDAYVQALEIARRRLDVPLVLVDEGRLPPLAPGHGLLTMFDVLEHIDDDHGTLAWLASVLEPGGYLVLTVPAHPFLFDESDERAHHRRRYRREEMREKLRAAGFEIELLTHFMAPLVPILAALRAPRRLMGRRTVAPRGWDAQLRVVPGINTAFRALLAVERRCLRLVEPPFGSSLLAVARRPRLRA